MVKEQITNEKHLYQCEVCGLHYEDRLIAEKCQEWCGTHASCSLDIIKYAVESNQ